ncbi:MAG: hypothetical protein ACM3MK_01630, partial [Chitinophagales bacterium]
IPGTCLVSKKVSKLGQGTTLLKLKAKLPKGSNPSPGTYYIVAAVDCLGSIYEDDEENNVTVGKDPIVFN